MKKLMLFATLFAVGLSGCGADQAPDPTQSGLTGSDRDEHGCIGSAGYMWCERTGQCERPWELAEKEGFENTPEAFEAFCNGK